MNVSDITLLAKWKVYATWTGIVSHVHVNVIGEMEGLRYMDRDSFSRPREIIQIPFIAVIALQRHQTSIIVVGHF